MAEPKEEDKQQPEAQKDALPPKKRGHKRFELRLVADTAADSCTLYLLDGDKVVETLEDLKGSVIRLKAERLLKYAFLDEVINAFNGN